MDRHSESLTTQVDSEILSAVREIAGQEGRQVQALVNEALADLVEKRKIAEPRQCVMDAYRSSQEQYASLYKKLAE